MRAAIRDILFTAERPYQDMLIENGAHFIRLPALPADPPPGIDAEAGDEAAEHQ
jgi:hypothetical protein